MTSASRSGASAGRYGRDTNLYSRRYDRDQDTNNNIHHSPNRVSSYNTRGTQGDTKYTPLSDRIKRLTSTKVLKESGGPTSHNNNEPFSYLKGAQKFQQGNPRDVVVYAQVVVDPNGHSSSSGGVGNKRTVHRSYNTLNKKPIHIDKPIVPPRPLLHQNGGRHTDMRGRNVTTVLLNSSSDDMPSSYDYDAQNTRFRDYPAARSSSSPLLFSTSDYYPKSPGIVKQHLNTSSNFGRSRYENHYHQQRSSHQYSDDEDDYYGRNKPFKDLSDTNSGDDYHYQPINYRNKSASTNLIDSYGYKSGGNKYSHRIDEEEDEYDLPTPRSKTLDRDYKNSRTEEFINRSRTLDNRISSLRERSLMLEEYNKKQGLGGSSDLLSSHPSGKPKEKSSSNIFSTLLRRNKNKSMSTSTLPNRKHAEVDNKPEAAKKGTGVNFFTSFLEKKRAKKQQHQQAMSSNSVVQNWNNHASSTLKSRHGQEANHPTYQSYGGGGREWNSPAPLDPPSFSVVDYSEPPRRPPPPSATTRSSYYNHNSRLGESNIDTEDGASDVWKKSYGSDVAKVKRRWTFKEPSNNKPNPIYDDRSLDRKGYSSSSTTRLNSASTADRVRNLRNFSETDEREGSYDNYLRVPNNANGRRHGSNYDVSYGSGTLNRRNVTSKGGGFVGASSGSESNNNNRSVYLHEPAVIPEMPRTTAVSGGLSNNPNASLGGGDASLLSGLSGRRTLSKDEISNYSGSKKETKQLSRSMSLAHPWGPSKHYREKYSEIDYSNNNNANKSNLHLPPRPPSRSPSGSLGLHKASSRSPPKTSNPPVPFRSSHLQKSGVATGLRKARPTPSSSVESLLRQDHPVEQRRTTSNTLLGRSRSMLVSSKSKPENPPQTRNKFSTLWFNRKQGTAKK